MNTSPAPKPRYRFLDIFRGLLVISMVIYHFLWDLVFLKGMDLPWYRNYTTPVRLWQTFMRFFFIMISGYCLNLSGHPLKRGLELSVCGALITAVTVLFMPENAVIFGVLTFLGAATLIGTPVRRHYNGGRVKSAICLLLSIVFYVVLRGVTNGFIGIMFRPVMKLPRALYRGYFMTFLGFIDPHFRSTDYVPFFPWIFVYFMGFFLGRLTLPYLAEKSQGGGFFHDAMPRASGALIWIGRHALIIYMIHQPILAGITYLMIYAGL